MSRALSSRLGHVSVLCSWVRHFTFTGPLSTQDYIWILLSRKPDEMLGSNLQWTDIPSGDKGGDVKPKPKKSHRPTR